MYDIETLEYCITETFTLKNIRCHFIEENSIQRAKKCDLDLYN